MLDDYVSKHGRVFIADSEFFCASVRRLRSGKYVPHEIGTANTDMKSLSGPYLDPTFKTSGSWHPESTPGMRAVGESAQEEAAAVIIIK